jgi:hypothetical protein
MAPTSSPKSERCVPFRASQPDNGPLASGTLIPPDTIETVRSHLKSLNFRVQSTLRPERSLWSITNGATSLLKPLAHIGHERIYSGIKFVNGIPCHFKDNSTETHFNNREMTALTKFALEIALNNYFYAGIGNLNFHKIVRRVLPILFLNNPFRKVAVGYRHYTDNDKIFLHFGNTESPALSIAQEFDCDLLPPIHSHDDESFYRKLVFKNRDELFNLLFVQQSNANKLVIDSLSFLDQGPFILHYVKDYNGAKFFIITEYNKNFVQIYDDSNLIPIFQTLSDRFSFNNDLEEHLNGVIHEIEPELKAAAKAVGGITHDVNYYTQSSTQYNIDQLTFLANRKVSDVQAAIEKIHTYISSFHNPDMTNIGTDPVMDAAREAYSQEFDKANVIAVLSQLKKDYKRTDNINFLLDTGGLNRVFVMVPKENLRVIFRNLFENAVKYNLLNVRSSPSVDIRIDKKNLIIDIQNISEELPLTETQRLFNKGFRGSQAKQLRLAGIGVGLYHVRQIADLCGLSVKHFQEHKASTGKSVGSHQNKLVVHSFRVQVAPKDWEIS